MEMHSQECWLPADNGACVAAMTLKSKKTRPKFLQDFQSSNQHSTVVKSPFLKKKTCVLWARFPVRRDIYVYHVDIHKYVYIQYIDIHICTLLSTPLNALNSERSIYYHVPSVSCGRVGRNSTVSLVGGWPTPLKNIKVSWAYYSYNIWETQYMGK